MSLVIQIAVRRGLVQVELKIGDKIQIQYCNADFAKVYEGQILIISELIYDSNDVRARTVEDYYGFTKGMSWRLSPGSFKLVETNIVIKCEEDYYKWLANR